MTDLEKQINDTVSDALAKGVQSVLASSYGNPIGQLAEQVINNRSAEITKLFDDALTSAFSEEFCPALRSACAHKLAKVLVSKMEGEIEKKANDLRSNPETRAKITLAITECLKAI